MDENQLTEIGRIVCEATQEIFAECGAASDYCVQHVGLESVVFGSTNRVVWSPRNGWRVDRSYCTDRFLNCWDNLPGNER